MHPLDIETHSSRSSIGPIEPTGSTEPLASTALIQSIKRLAARTSAVRVRLVLALALAGVATGCAATAASTSTTLSPDEDEEDDVVDETPSPAARDLQAPLLEGMGEHTRDIGVDDPTVQRLFDQGLVLHYGFNHAEAVRSFAEAARLDPTCAVCFAGVALSLGPNINAPMDPANVDRAWSASRKALELAEHARPADQALITAVGKRYASEAPDDRSDLDRLYAESLQAAHEAHPNDADVASLYAEALMVEHPWNYWDEDTEPHPWTPHILETLESTLAEAPKHPFANHLYIHAVEASSEPERALKSAEVLEDLVPAAGHLVHMPSHVYIRTGDYHAASKANERAIQADQNYLEQVEAQGLYPLAYYPHNYHFLWATTLLEGRAERSLEAARGVAARADREKMRTPGFGTLQHYLSIPYYAHVAFGRWDTILDMAAPPEDLRYPTAVWHYARGMALANTGRTPEATRALEKVEAAAADEALDEITIWDINSTRHLMKIAAAMLAADIARAQGDLETAIAHLERAVELEDALNYDEPPPWGPATRRHLGAVLLQADQAERAEAVYRADLDNFPENGWSLFGLAQSLRAQRADDPEAVSQSDIDAVQKRFEQAWRHADVELIASRF